MSERAYQGVILAAGHGSRMGPFGEQLPKPIAPICNKPLLGYQLDFMREAGIRDVTVVIGHLGHRIIQTLGDGEAYGVRIRYVEQEKRLGIAHAVGQLEPYLSEPFLLSLGDIFFELPSLDALFREFEAHEATAVLAVKEEPDPAAIRRNFAVYLREDGAVRRVIEKPRRVTNRLKGCGLYLFDPVIFEAIQRTPRTAMRDEYELTDSIQILIDYEYSVRVAPVVEWDMNVTVVDDLLACCLHVLGKTGASNCIGEDCHVDPKAELRQTVLGDGVHVAGPAKLEECVVMPGVRIEGGGTYRRKVFTQGTTAHEQPEASDSRDAVSRSGKGETNPSNIRGDTV